MYKTLLALTGVGFASYLLGNAHQVSLQKAYAKNCSNYAYGQPLDHETIFEKLSVFELVRKRFPYLNSEETLIMYNQLIKK